LRAAAHRAHVSATYMPEFAQEFVKYFDGQDATAASQAAAALETERNALKQVIDQLLAGAAYDLDELKKQGWNTEAVLAVQRIREQL
jgi:hypothetical protein